MGILFDGTDDSAQTGALYGNNDVVSISVWLYWPAAAGVQDYQYSYILQNQVFIYCYSLGGTQHKFLTRVYCSGVWRDVTDQLNSFDTWYNYIVTMDNTVNEQRGYVDGTQRGQQSLARDNVVSSVLSIGDDFNLNHNAQIRMAELAIWEGYKLTSGDIAALQTQSPKDVHSGNLAGYWPFGTSLAYDTYGSNFTEDAGSGITILGDSYPTNHPIQVSELIHDYNLRIIP